MIARKSGFKPATWRYYKAAVSFYLTECDYSALAIELKRETNKGVSYSTQKKADTVLKTSSLKQKYITLSQQDKIESLLEAQQADGQFWAGPLLTFIRASLLVGLRPSEWPNATMFIDSQPAEHYVGNLPVLMVKNGKATNGRSFDEYRYIDLSQLEDVALACIYHALILAAQRQTPAGVADSYDDYYKALRGKMYSINLLLFASSQKNISLYSCRHQFIADLKHADYTLQQIAALVGHGSDATATIHYGKKKSGRARGNLPLAHQLDVEKIKAQFSHREMRVLLKLA